MIVQEKNIGRIATTRRKARKNKPSSRKSENFENRTLGQDSNVSVIEQIGISFTSKGPGTTAETSTPTAGSQSFLRSK